MGTPPTPTNEITDSNGGDARSPRSIAGFQVVRRIGPVGGEGEMLVVRHLDAVGSPLRMMRVVPDDRWPAVARLLADEEKSLGGESLAAAGLAPTVFRLESANLDGEFTRGGLLLFAPLVDALPADTHKGSQGLLALTRSVLQGLDFLHGRGVSHGAVQPQAIRRPQGGPLGASRLLFDPAMRLRSEQAQQGEHAPDDRYRPPGQRVSKHTATPAGDLYALGVVLADCLAGDAVPYKDSPEFAAELVGSLDDCRGAERGFVPFTKWLLAPQRLNERTTAREALEKLEAITAAGWLTGRTAVAFLAGGLLAAGLIRLALGDVSSEVDQLKARLADAVSENKRPREEPQTPITSLPTTTRQAALREWWRYVDSNDSMDLVQAKLDQVKVDRPQVHAQITAWLSRLKATKTFQVTVRDGKAPSNTQSVSRRIGFGTAGGGWGYASWEWGQPSSSGDADADVWFAWSPGQPVRVLLEYYTGYDPFAHNWVESDYDGPLALYKLARDGKILDPETEVQFTVDVDFPVGLPDPRNEQEVK